MHYHRGCSELWTYRPGMVRHLAWSELSAARRPAREQWLIPYRPFELLHFKRSSSHRFGRAISTLGDDIHAIREKPSSVRVHGEIENV
jgi:hypothetical protein